MMIHDRSLRLLAAALTATLLGSTVAQAAGDGLPVPQIFAPGVISGPANDGAPTFSPDGDELFFERGNGNWNVILQSRRVGGRWTAPTVASFSGPSSDQQPAMAPDGRYLVYVSTRAQPSSAAPGAPLVLVNHLWRVERTATGWSAPVELPAEVNISRRVFKPSVAANGDLYFMADTLLGRTPAWRLYKAAATPGGGYAAAVPLSFSDGRYGDVDPGVAPDQSFIVFSSKDRPPMDDGHEHLFVAWREGAGWTAPVPVRYDGDTWGADDGEAQVGRDGRTLYFISGRSPPIHRMRSRAEMMDDLARLEAWDNSNNNVWTIPLPARP